MKMMVSQMPLNTQDCRSAGTESRWAWPSLAEGFLPKFQLALNCTP